MKLTEQERHSELWRKLKAHFEARLQKHRVANDKAQAAEETAKLRGRIAELKELMNLENPGVTVIE